MRGLALAALVSLILGTQDAPPLPEDNLPEGFLTGSVPFGLPEAGVDPEGVTYPKDVVALGRKLFFDPILSSDRSVSCASCHEPQHGFSSPQAFPLGAEGRRATRSSPTLFNRAFGKTQMWDGSIETLEEQALQPIENPNEMNLPLDEALERLAQHESYSKAFAQSFEDGLNRDNLAKALASFVRRIVYGDSPIDRFRIGEVAGLTASERSGFWIYESRGKCWKCHGGGNFTNEKFHNTGIGAADGIPEDGRYAVTKDEQDRGKFKTPTLRGLTQTAPYMHDGSLKTLREVVEFYREGGHQNSHLDPIMNTIDLSEEDVDHMVAFLQALSRVATGKPQPLSDSQ